MKPFIGNGFKFFIMEINILEDIRDKVLKVSLLREEDVKNIAKILAVSNTDVLKAAHLINNDKGWYAFHSTFGGEIASLIGDEEDINMFLQDGGYSKQEYLRRIDDDEMMLVLREMKGNGNKIQISVTDRDYPYFRLGSIIDILKGKQLIKPRTLNKVSEVYEISDKGAIALNDNTTINNSSVINMSKNIFNGPTQYVEGGNNGKMDQDNGVDNSKKK